MKKLVLGMTLLASVATIASEGNDFTFTAGVGVGVGKSIYKLDKETELIPLVPISARYKNMYLDATGMEAGVCVYSQNDLKLAIFGKYNKGYKGKDLEDRYNKMEDKKDFQLGIKSIYNYNNLEFGSFASYDVSDNSNGGMLGVNGKINIFLIPQKLIFTPGISAKYMSDNYTDYFYGVTKSEATKMSAVNEYNVGDTMVYSLNASLTYIYDSNLVFMLLSGMNFYESKVENSPIVDRDKDYFFGGAVVYKF